MLEVESRRDDAICRVLDEARAELLARGTLDLPAWQARHPDLGEELRGLLEMLRHLDLAASDWKEAGDTAAGLCSPTPVPPVPGRAT